MNRPEKKLEGELFLRIVRCVVCNRPVRSEESKKRKMGKICFLARSRDLENLRLWNEAVRSTKKRK